MTDDPSGVCLVVMEMPACHERLDPENSRIRFRRVDQGGVTAVRVPLSWALKDGTQTTDIRSGGSLVGVIK
jgi:hypothetical protein